MAQGSIKLEIDQESYDRVHGQLSDLYDLSQKIRVGEEKGYVRLHYSGVIVIGFSAFLAGNYVCWLIFTLFVR